MTRIIIIKRTAATRTTRTRTNRTAAIIPRCSNSLNLHHVVLLLFSLLLLLLFVAVAVLSDCSFLVEAAWLLPSSSLSSSSSSLLFLQKNQQQQQQQQYHHSSSFFRTITTATTKPEINSPRTTTTATTIQQSSSSSNSRSSHATALMMERTTKTTTSSSSSSSTDPKKIYSLPALYDLAFGYRDFTDEVTFLLKQHQKHHMIQPPAGGNNLLVLELAAGPARHSITALCMQQEEDEEDEDDEVLPKVDAVVCIDLSNDMKVYAEEIAVEELSTEMIESSFYYKIDDIRTFQLDTYDGTFLFDTAWLLLGSLQHLQTNDEVISCLTNIYNVLKPGGTIVIELPHPKELFSLGECTRNGWEVPLEDDTTEESENELGTLQIIWGDDGDLFDPITQVRQFTISMELNEKKNKKKDSDTITTTTTVQSVNEIVPMRIYTSQEIDLLAKCCGFQLVAQYGALSCNSEENGGDGYIDVNDEELAYRLVCILRKPPSL